MNTYLLREDEDATHKTLGDLEWSQLREDDFQNSPSVLVGLAVEHNHWSVHCEIDLGVGTSLEIDVRQIGWQLWGSDW